MSQNPQIVYPCDHYIQENIKIYGEIEVTRNIDVTIPDKMADNIVIVRIDQIYKINAQEQKVFYYNGYNYNQSVSTNILEWIPNINTNPAPGEKYFVQCFYIKISANKYESDRCPRCGGNGWYVSLIDNAATAIKVFEGKSKLSQDFIKILYTDKQSNGYGSNIKDIIGLPIYDPGLIYTEIASILTDCGEQIKEIQKQIATDGLTISDEEKLSRIVINKVQYVKDELCFYVSISMINALGEGIKFNFKV